MKVNRRSKWTIARLRSTFGHQYTNALAGLKANQAIFKEAMATLDNIVETTEMDKDQKVKVQMQRMHAENARKDSGRNIKHYVEVLARFEETGIPEKKLLKYC